MVYKSIKDSQVPNFFSFPDDLRIFFDWIFYEEQKSNVPAQYILLGQTKIPKLKMLGNFYKHFYFSNF